eukprot:NODE_4423_length_341_cov_117.565068_g3980_i0.p1 GENE.NODE_4423_length_341_cov_117.565068_g3980_i0~~NODE_4423_length_341_cov_117.565068_g3980_i0.p1  ORF type:complete len:60 (-),score=6.80 NODE_4423_length_341_cov_117.565068_g3980_i0:14-193(-)
MISTNAYKECDWQWMRQLGLMAHQWPHLSPMPSLKIVHQQSVQRHISNTNGIHTPCTLR